MGGRGRERERGAGEEGEGVGWMSVPVLKVLASSGPVTGPFWRGFVSGGCMQWGVEGGIVRTCLSHLKTEGSCHFETSTCAAGWMLAFEMRGGFGAWGGMEERVRDVWNRNRNIGSVARRK